MKQLHEYIQHNHIELWAGVECTLNRVQNQYFDQLACNGHITHIEDLEKFAALGIRTLRYPVLWEHTAPDHPHQLDWSWADERLHRLRELGIRPIAGLLHHGSGPKYTSLVDPDFVELFAGYASAFAQRYPWIEYYTPVNEPLTTARFSGMYGHWYPHGKDGKTFAKALLTECKATIRAMQVIREVNPDAKLVQTEDLGKTFSTPLLAYQAALENERRWLSLDLLCGKLTEKRPMWKYLRSFGVSIAELNWFLDNPCPPDIIGINHYLTSERFLDERLERYPSCTHGGNEYHRYADVEAVRVLMPGTAGPQVLMQETWERYQLPIAITEAHLSCTREEQMRWLKQIWESAQNLQSTGVNVRAVTVWSLLGSYNWNSLVTCDNNYYEPGVFDLRSPEPRPTALTGMIRAFSQGHSFHHPLLEQPGWWLRSSRLLYPPVRSVQDAVIGLVAKSEHKPENYSFTGDSSAENKPIFGSRINCTNAASHYNNLNKGNTAPLLILESIGTLGKSFARLCEVRAIPYRLLPESKMDIASPDNVRKVLTALKPWAVINTAEYNQIDNAEQEQAACFHINTYSARNIAAECSRQGIPILSFSTDQVFDGDASEPYLESSPVNPLNVFGRSKAEAERQILKAHPGALIVRTGPLLCPWDEDNFLTIELRTLEDRLPIVATGDRLFSPTYVPDLVNACLDLLLDGESGIWHLANIGAVTFADLIWSAAQVAALNTRLIEFKHDYTLDDFSAPQPRYSVLSSERGLLLPTLEKALEDYCLRMNEENAVVKGSKRSIKRW